MKKKIVEYNPRGINNFHNMSPIHLVVSEITDVDTIKPQYVISEYQAKRIQKHFCGVSDCRCPGGGYSQIDIDPNIYAIPVKWCS